MTTKRVAVTRKPHAVPAVRSTWRKTAEQKATQAWRFLRIAGATLVGQVLAQLVATGGDVSNLDQKAVVGLAVGALEATWRQLHPALTVTGVDAAPGATLVPDDGPEVDGP